MELFLPLDKVQLIIEAGVSGCLLGLLVQTQYEGQEGVPLLFVLGVCVGPNSSASTPISLLCATSISHLKR